MGKLVDNSVLDAALNVLATADAIIVCADTPTTYANATATYDLATHAVTGADFANADDASGRKCTIAAQPTITIDHSGTATHIALVKSAGSVLLYVTTCTSQVLTAGNTVSIPAWKVTIPDPA